MSDEAHEATPDHELERQIMSYNEAKNEREWWAMHEIERLREALCDCHHVLHKLMAIVPGNDAVVDEMAKVMKKARAALGEGKDA
jgi:hypothetical protein